MSTHIRFLGATQGVTGSRYVVEAAGRRLLIDCGLYQEREFLARNWDPFPVPPGSVAAVLLTHAHLDHCGLLPKFVREGFHGPIHCTQATADLTEIVLLDAAGLQEEDARHKSERHESEGRKGPHEEAPLYTTDEARAVSRFFSPVAYEQALPLAPGLEATFREAGHILGSASIELRIGAGSDARTLVFSGDIGRPNRPILRDPCVFTQADYVVMESTYGDRVHDAPASVSDALAGAIDATRRAGGNVLIPTFAIERAQEVLYEINRLRLAKRLPPLMVFVDSPMAVRATRVMMKHAELFDEDMTALLARRESPFSFPGLQMVETAEGSKTINNIRGTSIILAGSGMCTGGRIKHHLVQNISRPESAVLFVGYQAAGTLGRLISGGAKDVRILGQSYAVKAHVEMLHGFSGHADRAELTQWLSALRRPPRRVFVTHGEPEAAQSFAAHVGAELHYATTVPRHGDEAVLD